MKKLFNDTSNPVCKELSSKGLGYLEIFSLATVYFIHFRYYTLLIIFKQLTLNLLKLTLNSFERKILFGFNLHGQRNCYNREKK